MNITGFLWKNNVEGVWNMKITKEKMFYFTAVIVVASVIASSAIAIMTTNTSAKETEETATTQQSGLSYVLGEKNGMVAGFVKGVEIPYIRTDTPVNSLPYDVQERLRAGVEFESEQDMRQVM